ncbi:MAG: hypothetical protein MJ095_09490, partial [Oscillospiraceae bacterium]|nr:hypothetical protein [Oscillospiraceae bacterium]
DVVGMVYYFHLICFIVMNRVPVWFHRFNLPDLPVSNEFMTGIFIISKYTVLIASKNALL